MKNLTKEQISDLVFVLNFSLETIESLGAEKTTNKSNWTVGESLEDWIKILEKVE